MLRVIATCWHRAKNWYSQRFYEVLFLCTISERLYKFPRVDNVIEKNMWKVYWNHLTQLSNNNLTFYIRKDKESQLTKNNKSFVTIIVLFFRKLHFEIQQIISLAAYITKSASDFRCFIRTYSRGLLNN